jgi:hypothetical protein
MPCLHPVGVCVHTIYVSCRSYMCIMFGFSHHFVFHIAAPVIYRHVNENDPICRNVTCKRCQENLQNSETHALIKTPLARPLVERYKKRHLAVQVRSANGLRGIFKFSEILGRPTYVWE